MVNYFISGYNWFKKNVDPSAKRFGLTALVFGGAGLVLYAMDKGPEVSYRVFDEGRARHVSAVDDKGRVVAEGIDYDRDGKIDSFTGREAFQDGIREFYARERENRTGD